MQMRKPVAYSEVVPCRQCSNNGKHGNKSMAQVIHSYSIIYIWENTMVELLHEMQPSLYIVHQLSEWLKNCMSSILFLAVFYSEFLD
jgi:hypothetical protein